jgi:hypothetical protein
MGTDPDRITKILREIAEGIRMVVMKPAACGPVYRVRSTAPDFKLRHFAWDVNCVMHVKIRGLRTTPSPKRFVAEGRNSVRSA